MPSDKDVTDDAESAGNGTCTMAVRYMSEGRGMPSTRKSSETYRIETRSLKDEDLCSESGDTPNNSSDRRENAEHDPKETVASAARFARKELDYIAEMYVANYDLFHKSSQGGGRAKDAIAVKRKLLKDMADHLTALVDEKRTVMQIDQKIRDEVRQVKKYFRHKRQEMYGLGGYSREIRLSSSQQYIADNLRTKPRLAGLLDDMEARPMENAGPMSMSDMPFDYHPGCSTTEYCASLTFPADTTSFAEQSSLSLEASLCGLGDFHKPKQIEKSDSLDDLRREALRAEIDCARVRMEAANEEKKYWEEKRNLLALERRIALERHQMKPDEEHHDRIASAAEERLYWEERRRILALKKQCMLDQME
ncbi:unnamed protein product [Cylicocyclus nassatus]|uniref:Uncharacterized protein n=1 Tax=Cylicocyclus nassatus TaxID=53992 RepID=A0AA36M600_CYLNA|nr:unnamed protein product [Cylicocyclus nassatus]